MKRLFIWALMGLFALFLVYITSSLTGVSVPFGTGSIIVSAVMGICGVIALLIIQTFIF